MSDVKEVYEELDTEIEFEEFEVLVENKVDEMGGLVDELAAAILASQDFDQGKVDSIESLTTAMESAEFTAKVTSVGQLRTFEREDEDGESSQGHVCNVEVGDETGHVTLSLWDGMAKAAAENLEADEVLEIKGYPKDGYRGLEVSVKDIERVSDDGIDIRTFDTYQIEDLSADLSGIDVTGLLLDTTPVKTFDRDDGSTGKVANLILGDETGRVQVALWDEKADIVDDFEMSEALKVSNVNVRERDGRVEIHAGSWSTVEAVDEIIEYRPNTTDIKNLSVGDVATIAGTVSEAYERDTFTRDDGSEGSVRNVLIEDDTDSLRVALWGDKAEKEIEQGDELLLADITVRDGFEGGTEGSANWNSSITVIRKAADVPKKETEAPTESNSQATGLNEYDEPVESTPEDSDQDAGSDTELVEVTGTVLGKGDTITLEANGEQHAVATDEELRLGEQITVRGTVEDGTLHAEEIF